MTAATAPTAELDAATLTAIRNSLDFARRGRLGEACSTAERALSQGGDVVALNALLGMLRTRAGDAVGGVRHLEIAHEARPSDVHIAANFASALAAEGSLNRAFAVASPALAFSDPSLQLPRIRGYLAQMLGESSAAIEAYEHVVASDPADWESWNNLGNARNAAGDVEGGIDALGRAAAINPMAEPTRLNLARTYRQAGQFAEAEVLLEKMAEDFPDAVEALIDLHDLLKLQGRDEAEILATLDRALQRDPKNVELLIGRARHLTTMLEMEKAEEAYRAVLSRDRSNAAAFVGLSVVLEHSRAAALQELAEEAENNAVEPGTLNLVRAFAHRRANRHAEGIAALGNVPADFEAVRREHLLGQMLEGLKDYDAAFAAFERMNRLQSDSASDPIGRAEALRSTVRDQLARTTSDWLDQWKTPPLESARGSPIFLVGFPRSGTTLLDTFLMGHPDIEVMEERSIIDRVEGEFGGFDSLSGMDESQVRRAQNRYFEIAGEYADVKRGALIVDKSPLLLTHVPTIHRLFPDARFILALRHPADVVLSCFVSNFDLTASMSNFLQLDTAAEFYDLNFSSWENACALLPIDIHTVVYEQLVRDTETEVRRLSEWLGIQWRDEMLDHQATAARRGLIPTVSYAQVTEPIYKRSIGRWERYRKQLEPILPILSPWATKFGYRI